MRTGEFRDSVDRSPTCPKSFKPQHHKVPSSRVAQVCDEPAATLPQSVLDSTWYGTSRNPDVPPSPSCPSSLLPQHQSVWSSWMPHVWKPPAETDTQLRAAPTRVG